LAGAARLVTRLKPVELSSLVFYVLHLKIEMFYFRAVTDSINNLLNTAMTAAPGQKECESALRNIQVCGDFVAGFFTLSKRFGENMRKDSNNMSMQKTFAKIF
jgi:hypothetical protein